MAHVDRDPDNHPDAPFLIVEGEPIADPCGCWDLENRAIIAEAFNLADAEKIAALFSQPTADKPGYDSKLADRYDDLRDWIASRTDCFPDEIETQLAHLHALAKAAGLTTIEGRPL